MLETNPYIRSLLEANPIREPVLRAAIQALHLPLASRGLDAGCGVGLQALLLAEAVGPKGHITGLDIAPELLAYGKEIVQKAGMTTQITFKEGDVSRLPFADNTFDWAWSVDCIGYPLGEAAPLVAELMRVVRPGGIIAVLGWSSQQLLPGYPLLEARLNATCSAYMPFLRGKDPELNFLRAPRWFRQAGMADVTAQTFVGDVQAPLSAGQRTALISLLDMLWGQPQPEVSPADWKEFQRLCLPGSADFILDIPEYYAFFTYSMIRGTVPDLSHV